MNTSQRGGAGDLRPQVCVCGFGWPDHSVRSGYCPLRLEGKWEPKSEAEGVAKHWRDPGIEEPHYG